MVKVKEGNDERNKALDLIVTSWAIVVISLQNTERNHMVVALKNKRWNVLTKRWFSATVFLLRGHFPNPTISTSPQYKYIITALWTNRRGRKWTFESSKNSLNTLNTLQNYHKLHCVARNAVKMHRHSTDIGRVVMKERHYKQSCDLITYIIRSLLLV